MKTSVTEFRKDLFRLMDRAVDGELIEIVHKGNVIRLSVVAPQSKLARLVRRDTLVGSPDDLARSRREIREEMRSAMEKDWKEI